VITSMNRCGLLLVILAATAPVLEAGDLGSFERILIPTIADRPVPGAFGSQWVTEISGRYTGDQQLQIYFPTCPDGLPCGLRFVPPDTPFGSEAFYHGGVAPHGAILRTRPSLADNTLISARVRDLSRSRETWGTELPVVRESRLSRDPVVLLNVPNDDRFRVMIRMYDFEPTISGNPFHVTVYPLDGDTPVSDFMMPTAELSGAVYFAVASDLLLPVNAPDRLRVEIRTAIPSKIYALASITNNETQHVTIVTPAGPSDR
jgi:hypothetical protein